MDELIPEQRAQLETLKARLEQWYKEVARQPPHSDDHERSFKVVAYDSTYVEHGDDQERLVISFAVETKHTEVAL